MSAAIFGPTFLVVLAFVLLAVALPLWTFVDILRRRRDVFSATGLTKTAWIGLTTGLTVATFVLPFMGLITVGFCLNYLFRVRAKLK
jgi:hypothetical protein